jgi:precorrin-8X/cobalt-precorrin-8 methylmutase
MDYLKDPAEIYARSFAAIRAEADLSGLPAALEPVAVRLIHACGMTDLAADLRFDPGVVAAARQSLSAGIPVLADTEMTARAIIRARLPAANEIVCTLNDPSVPDLARKQGTTRSAAAVSLWGERLEGAVVAIGNAPTALFALLEALDDGALKPAAILAFPVGFVGAAESKAELAGNPRGVPFLTLLGRRGGSALAGAAVNALSAGEAE